MNQWRKGIAAWQCGRTLYLSVPFTWLLDEAQAIAEGHNKGPVVVGGPAVDLAMSDSRDTPEPINWGETPGTCPFDTLAFHNPCATFTTRGCPNRCEYCAVPKIEGELRVLDDWKPAPMVCDNNLLAAGRKHFSRVISSLRQFASCDFNQGLDARIFTPWHADQIAKLRHCKVRFAFDYIGMESKVADAITIARSAGLRDFGVYVLFGFKDTMDDALYRLEKVREWGIRPNPQRFQPLDAMKRDTHIAPGWTSRALWRVRRYYSKLAWLDHIPFEEYDPPAAGLFDDEERRT